MDYLPLFMHTGTRRKYVRRENIPLMRHIGCTLIKEKEFAQKCMEKSPAGAYNEKGNVVMLRGPAYFKQR
jgi:hypothetical protein